MEVSKLKLQDFRNYKDLDLELSPDINILYGDNAQGKTNILEAIYLLSTTKSHKRSKDKDMVRIGCEKSHLSLEFKKKDINHVIDMEIYTKGRKAAALDKFKIQRSTELFGMLNLVMFSPENLNMIKMGPAERRNFMDEELCQLNKLYLQTLSKYNKILNERNTLLKDINSKPSLKDTLDIWDDQLVETGTFIINTRNEFIKEINEVVKDIHSSISGGKEILNVYYAPHVTIDSFKKELQENHQKDIIQKTTTVGPHRDDMEFFLGNNNIKNFGSQGQQRTAALSLKLSEIKLLRDKYNENPVLLLDDVLSELDRNRQHCLLDYIEGTQTIITCTGLEEFVGYRSKFNKLYKVSDGTIEKI